MKLRRLALVSPWVATWLSLLPACTASLFGFGGDHATVSAERGEPTTSEGQSVNALERTEASRRQSGVFLRNRRAYCFAGANNNYLLHKSPEVVNDVFVQAKDMGLRVVRTWAFVDRGSLDGSVPSVDGDGTKEGVFLRYWDRDKQRLAYNEGEKGLERLDAALAMARDNGVQLTLVLTNNWREFGGIDQYVVWYHLANHQAFFTDTRARHAYKQYVKLLVERVNTITGVAYRDDPTIFSWELANDPRCLNGGPFDDPTECRPEVITQWADEMSRYVRALDPNHLVAVGDAGFFAKSSGPDWMYNGSVGVDHSALVALPAVDYATFQLYPEHWRMPVGTGVDWIEAQVRSGHAVAKPIVLTEYGQAVATIGSQQQQQASLEERVANYASWNEALLKGGASGSLFWQLLAADSSQTAEGFARDYDGLAVYNREGDALAALLRAVAEQFDTQASVCRGAEQAFEALGGGDEHLVAGKAAAVSTGVSDSPFVSTRTVSVSNGIQASEGQSVEGSPPAAAPGTQSSPEPDPELEPLSGKRPPGL